MRTRSAIAVAALLTAVGLIIWGDYGVPDGDGGAAAAGLALRCGSVVDSAGYQQGPLTASLAVASLTALPFADGAAGNPGGSPTSADASTLDTMAVELIGYSGSALADDAQAFAAAEFNYNPADPVDASYARPLGQAIRALQRDCPGGARLGLHWRRVR
jgi:hypothetical protein